MCYLFVIFRLNVISALTNYKNALPRSESLAPDLGHTFPSSESLAPDLGHTFPRSESLAPDLGHTSPEFGIPCLRFGADFPRGRDPLPQIQGIILFFKLWGMTNDIRELKKDHFDTRMPEDIPQLRAYLREKYIQGENEKVKSILIHEFLDNINAKCNSSRDSYLKTSDTVLDTDITEHVEALKKQFGKVNMEVPNVILNMKTFRDYYELFKNEDFN